jgi:hypothetical protein
LWRLATLAILLWIGRELYLLRQDIDQPAEPADTTTASADDLTDTLDDLRRDVATLSDKIDALAMALASRSR